MDWEYYPGYVDIDLKENYNLNTVEIFTQEKGYSQYSIYTSMNGRDFDKLAEKTSTESCTDKGEIYQAKGKRSPHYPCIYGIQFYKSSGCNQRNPCYR